jgi:hypothetical protein
VYSAKPALELAWSLTRDGRYVELVASVGAELESLQSMPQEFRVLVAQALLHAGDSARALAIAARDAQSNGTPPNLRSKCEIIIGLIERRNANIHEAARHLHLAVQLAKESGDPAQFAWASIQLFRMAAETQPPDGLAALFKQTRDCVTQAGDPHATAYMHDAISLMEIARGNLHEARRHQAIAHSLVSRNYNAWLAQILHIGSAYLDYFEGKPGGAVSVPSMKSTETSRSLRRPSDPCGCSVSVLLLRGLKLRIRLRFPGSSDTSSTRPPLKR